MRGRADTDRSAAVWPILRAPIQWVKKASKQKASKQWWISVSEPHKSRELLHSWTQTRLN